MLKKIIRTLAVVPVLRLTGYRFTKDHRHNESLFYRLFNTTMANQEAGLDGHRVRTSWSGNVLPSWQTRSYAPDFEPSL